MITVVGSINMDLSVHTPRLPLEGETLIGHDFQQSPGGKGANQAVAAAKLGTQVSFVGCLGWDPLGDSLADTLMRSGVDITHVRRTDASSTGIALIQVDAKGHNNIVVVPGANHTLTTEDIDTAARCFACSKLAMFQLEIPIHVVEYGLLRAKEAGCITILNPAPAQPLPETLLRCTDILAPNKVELSMLTGMPCTSDDEVLAAAAHLLRAGLPHIVVTLGARGALYMAKDKLIHLPAYKVCAVDTTAAGVSFLGAFAHRLEVGDSIEDAIQFGQRAASYTVQHLGAQPSLPSYADLS